MTGKKNLLDRFKEKYGNSDEYLIEKLTLSYHAEIGKAMKRAGLNQSQLAERMGVKQPYVSKLVNCNPNLTLRSLALIAKALDAAWEHPRLSDATARTNEVPGAVQVEDDVLQSIFDAGSARRFQVVSGAFSTVPLRSTQSKEETDVSHLANAA
jgi:transcriptional regulator with XRE-family HTH domain